MDSQQTVFTYDSVSNTTETRQRKKQMKASAKPVSLIHIKIVEEAINKMRIAGCVYKIVMPDGTTHEHDPNGVLSGKQRKKRQPSKYPYGALVRHYTPYVENLGIGDVAVIPIAPFDGATLIGAISAWASKTWGNKAHQIAQNTVNDTVEIMRFK